MKRIERKTRLMRQVEEYYHGRPIEEIMADLRYGRENLEVDDMSIRLGIAKSTASKWMKLADLMYKPLAIRYMRETRMGQLRVLGEGERAIKGSREGSARSEKR